MYFNPTTNITFSVLRDATSGGQAISIVSAIFNSLTNVYSDLGLKYITIKSATATLVLSDVQSQSGNEGTEGTGTEETGTEVTENTDETQQENNGG